MKAILNRFIHYIKINVVNPTKVCFHCSHQGLLILTFIVFCSKKNTVKTTYKEVANPILVTPLGVEKLL